MGLFKKTKNRKVPLSKMKKWADTQQLAKVVELLEQGDRETILMAVGFLSTINMINVKRELLKCLDAEDEEIALKTAKSLEYMGVTPEERLAVEKCKKKWGKSSIKSKKKQDKGDDKGITFQID